MNALLSIFYKMYSTLNAFCEQYHVHQNVDPPLPSKISPHNNIYKDKII